MTGHSGPLPPIGPADSGAHLADKAPAQRITKASKSQAIVPAGDTRTSVLPPVQLRKPTLSEHKAQTRRNYPSYAAAPLHLPLESLSRVAAHLRDKRGLEFLINGVPGSHDAGRGAPELPALSPEDAAPRLLALRDTAKRLHQTQSFHHGTEKTAPHSWLVQGKASGTAVMDTYLVTPRGMVTSLLGSKESLSTQWTVQALRDIDPGVHYADSDVSRFLVLTDMEKLQLNRRFTGPQSGRTECGPLGIGQSEEYRKDGALQLFHDALLVRNLPGQGERPTDFLLPAPLVTRYSQPASYMKILRAMVSSDEHVATVEHTTENGTTITRRVRTLAGLAAMGAKFTLVDSDEEVDLASFRERWLAVFDTDATHERERMDVVMPDGTVKNSYAEHLVQRYDKIANRPLP